MELFVSLGQIPINFTGQDASPCSRHRQLNLAPGLKGKLSSVALASQGKKPGLDLQAINTVKYRTKIRSHP